MRTSASILLAALTACSRADALAVDHHKQANLRVRTPALDTLTDAQDARDPAHIFSLPNGFGYMMTPGEEPSPTHTAGTVYMLGGADGAWSLTIAEWDLATGKAFHRAVLPQAPSAEARVMANDGGALHVVNTGPDGRSYYTRLSPELKVLSRTSIDDLGDAKTIASDGNVTVITGCRWFYGAAGPCLAATYDQRGALIASRSLDGDWQEFGNMHDDAAVVDGHVYVLLLRDGNDGGSGLHVDELARDLSSITSSIVPVKDEHWFRDSTLRSSGNRLLVDVPPARYEFSPDLADVKDVPRGAPPPQPRFIGHSWCQEHVRAGPVDAFGCWRNPETAEKFVAWDRYRPD